MNKILHLLHADDDIDDRWIFRDGVTECGPHIQLTQFEDGAHLLQYMKANLPGLHTTYAIVCDMQMPIVNGLGVLNTVRFLSAWQNAPVVMLSTSSLIEDIQNCKQLGALAFYSKPNTLTECRSVIKDIIAACVKEPKMLL